MTVVRYLKIINNKIKIVINSQIKIQTIKQMSLILTKIINNKIHQMIAISIMMKRITMNKTNSNNIEQVNQLMKMTAIKRISLKKRVKERAWNIISFLKNKSPNPKMKLTDWVLSLIHI